MDLNASDAQLQISELRDSYSVSVKTLEVTDKMIMLNGTFARCVAHELYKTVVE